MDNLSLEDFAFNNSSKFQTAYHTCSSCDNMSFSGKTVVVTGGAQGLGRTLVQKFHEAGACVVAMDKNETKLAQLKVDLPQVTTIPVDITDWEAVRTELDKLDALDVLVNNAALVDFQWAPEITEAFADLTFAVNFKAALNLSQLFVKQVIAKGLKGGSIVNISSMADQKALPGCLMYCCSKAALVMMTKGLAQEFGKHDIRVNAVRPTAMGDTEAFERASAAILGGKDAFVNNVVSTAPISRLLETADVAELVLFLASSKSSMITGQAIAIDGGQFSL